MLTALLIVCYRSRDCRDIPRTKQIPTSPLHVPLSLSLCHTQPPGSCRHKAGRAKKRKQAPFSSPALPCTGHPCGENVSSEQCIPKEQRKRGRRTPASASGGPAPAPTSPGLNLVLSRSGLTWGMRSRQCEGGARLRVRAPLWPRREAS